jgi:gamma-glutamyltranspeptidase/glutathione hydrolase
VVDGYAAMPGAGRADTAPLQAREIRTDYGGGLTMAAGHASVAVPGALAALDVASSRWGRLPWAEVVEPAQHLARDGFTLGSAAGYYLAYVRESLFAWDPQTAAALRHPDGSWVEPGERMMVANLADTLALIAAEGAATMYVGELAERIVADMTDRGGRVSRQDLADYRAVLRPALQVEAGPWSLATNPPPAIGGAVLAAMLTLLGERPKAQWTPADVAHLVAVQRRVLDVRRDVLDVADDREGAALSLLREIGWRAPTAPSTVHISVVDGEGTAAAITASSGYGSGVTVPGTGLWLNNCLGELELNRGATLAPGERLRSNMAPTVGRTPDGAVLAVGSPGADRITTALLQVLAPFAHAGTSLQEAVDRPRLHVHHLDDGSVQVEAEEDLPLPALDLPVRQHHAHSMYFGGVGAALRRGDGSMTAAADPRRAGVSVSSSQE